MPSKSEIFTQAKRIKVHYLEKNVELKENEVWASGKRGATFEFMKPEGIIFDEQDASYGLFLVLRGKPKGKEELKGDFVAALGKPKIEMPAGKHHPQILIWQAASLTPKSK